MKAKKKTVLIGVLALLDCLFGSLVAYDILTDNVHAKVASVKASGNYVIVEDIFDEVAIATKKEIKEKKEIENTIVFDGMTMTELGQKLNKSLKSSLKGKGDLIASYSLKKGVDPYVATAIMLHETGCEWGCSNLVKKCHNVGGQKGSGCNGYKYYSSLDVGIKKFIDNLAKNYYAKGLNTPDKINTKYATSKSWSKKVNNYVKKIKSK